MRRQDEHVTTLHNVMVCFDALRRQGYLVGSRKSNADFIIIIIYRSATRTASAEWFVCKKCGTYARVPLPSYQHYKSHKEQIKNR